MVASKRLDTVNLGAEEFRDFRDYLQAIAGINLGDNKQYLVATRIRRVLSDNDCVSLSDLTRLIRMPRGAELRQKVIDVMTTNETFWFRDNYPFDYLKNKILPELHKQSHGARMRIWSAACSFGQEPYSLSMTVDECIKANFAIRDLNVEIVATDLSSEALDQAKKGVYDQLSMSRGMSDQRLREYFKRVENGRWQANSSVGKRINFRPQNLQDSYAALGKFDIICCRNVLIYFSAELKKDILTRLHASLKPNGVLFLGSSESLAAASPLFDMVHCNPGVMYRAK
ncbi:MAG: chemotaxis protein [Alteromonadaceae bacterium]|nr:MAG: chemotaxis protein [Alteromonadaceae bacterium]